MIISKMWLPNFYFSTGNR